MEKQNLINALRQFELLQNFSQEELELLSEKAKMQKAGKYAYIFMPDERSEHVFFLLKGRLKCGCFAADGREVIKEILKPSSMFGEMALAGENRRADFVQVLEEEALYLAIPATDLMQHLQRVPGFMMSFLFHLRERLGKVEDRLSALVLKDARSRIIDFLVDSAAREGKQVGYETLVRHCLTQQDIANLTGTSRQTVTSVLNELKRKNRIYFTRHSILIRDIASLA